MFLQYDEPTTFSKGSYHLDSFNNTLSKERSIGSREITFKYGAKAINALSTGLSRMQRNQIGTVKNQKGKQFSPRSNMQDYNGNVCQSLELLKTQNKGSLSRSKHQSRNIERGVSQGDTDKFMKTSTQMTLGSSFYGGEQSRFKNKLSRFRQLQRDSPKSNLQQNSMFTQQQQSIQLIVGDSIQDHSRNNPDNASSQLQQQSMNQDVQKTEIPSIYPKTSQEYQLQPRQTSFEGYQRQSFDVSLSKGKSLIQLRKQNLESTFSQGLHWSIKKPDYESKERMFRPSIVAFDLSAPRVYSRMINSKWNNLRDGSNESIEERHMLMKNKSEFGEVLKRKIVGFVKSKQVETKEETLAEFLQRHREMEDDGVVIAPDIAYQQSTDFLLAADLQKEPQSQNNLIELCKERHKNYKRKLMTLQRPLLDEMKRIEKGFIQNSEYLDDIQMKKRRSQAQASIKKLRKHILYKRKQDKDMSIAIIHEDSKDQDLNNSINLQVPAGSSLNPSKSTDLHRYSLAASSGLSSLHQMHGNDSHLRTLDIKPSFQPRCAQVVVLGEYHSRLNKDSVEDTVNRQRRMQFYERDAFSRAIPEKPLEGIHLPHAYGQHEEKRRPSKRVRGEEEEQQ
ncbi:hypothetical protein FGO68_gene16352 [Halteria grandinella]|uniref:Uncharacterized protein n=1 Tax=Halteria grandinella TaxID=5974 RepID=A0A8J8T4N5_HALGN|nr:hypothetical protein FGO68_gene16352 [Halteria grandinella]